MNGFQKRLLVATLFSGVTLGLSPAVAQQAEVEVLRIVHLRYAPAMQMAKIVSQVAQNQDAIIKIGVDDRTNSLIMKGRNSDIDTAIEVVNALDKASSDRPDPAENRGRIVSLAWLVAGTGKDELLAPLPERFGPIAKTLKESGIEGLRLGAQAMVTVNDDSRFTLSCTPQSDIPSRLTMKGQFFVDAKQSRMMELDILASRLDKKELARVDTVVTAPLGHPVVLAIAPTDTFTSVFVITVSKSPVY